MILFQGGYDVVTATQTLGEALKLVRYTCRNDDLASIRTALFTILSNRDILTIFTSVAGLSEDAQGELITNLTGKIVDLGVESVDIAENFIAIRFPEGLILRSARNIQLLLDRVSNIMDTAFVPTDNCVLCEQKATSKALFRGLYAYCHPTCIGINHRTQPTPISDETIEELAADMLTYRESLLTDLIKILRIPSVKGRNTRCPHCSETANALQTWLDIGQDTLQECKHR